MPSKSSAGQTVLGILECDILYPDLIEDYRSYGTMLAGLLQRFSPHLQVRYFAVQQGELPALNDECDAYLLTGSKSGVYDDDPWIAPLGDWIRTAHAQGQRMIGICFGHQMLAHSLGGHAARSEKGWGVGNHMTRTDKHPMWMNDSSPAYQLIYSHRDQVQTLPPGAKRFAGSDFCEYASWYLNDQILTFQGHPEFTPEYFRRLLERRRTDVGDDLLNSAMSSIEQPNDSEKVARWMLEFIHLPTSVK